MTMHLAMPTIRTTVTWAVALALLATVALLTGGEVSAQARPLKKLQMTIPVPALLFESVYIAQDKGFFADEGLEMDVLSTNGDGPDVDALISGSVQFTASTSNRLLTTYQQGKPLKGIMSVVNRMAIHCFVNKESAQQAGLTPKTPLTERFKKLKGMTFASSRAGSASYLLGLDYVLRGGLNPQKDVTMVSVGAQAMVASIENRQTDIGCFASPTPELAVSRGKTEWFVNNSLGEDPAFADFLFEVLFVRPDYARDNPAIVRSVTKALVRANQWAAQAKPQDHLEIVGKRFQGLGQGILLESVANVRKSIVDNGCVSHTAYDAVEAFLKRVDVVKTDVPFGAVIDNSFLPSSCS